MNRFIECVDVGKIYPGKTGPVEALRGIDFTCNAGDFTAIREFTHFNLICW